MNILILGGGKVVGKNIVDYASVNSDFNLILANRGITKTPDIIIDRDNEKGCFDLKNKEYDVVVDFSCYNLNQFKNTYQSLKFNRYIFISTSAVEAIPFQNVGPDMYEMVRYAHNKKECEDFIINNIKDYSIVRPCYIVGKDDYTNRFYRKDNKYYWNNGLELTYYIEADALSRLIFNQLNNSSNTIVNPCK
jgi:hypothetical protein